MKLVTKVIHLLIVGLCVTIIIYPLMHELSHELISLIMGNKIVMIRILPSPYVICEMHNMSNIKLIIIGISGTLIPYIICLILPEKLFWMGYIKLILLGTATLSMIISAISSILFILNTPISNDDITIILNIIPEGAIFITMLSLLLSTYSIRRLIKSKAISRVLNYLSI